MLAKLNLRNKILVPIGLMVLVVSCIAIGMVVVLVDGIFRKNALMLAQESGRRTSALIEGDLQKAFGVAHTLSGILSGAVRPSATGWEEDVTPILESALRAHPDVYALWAIFSPDASTVAPPPVLCFRWIAGNVQAVALEDMGMIRRMAETILRERPRTELLTEPVPLWGDRSRELYVTATVPVLVNGNLFATVGLTFPVTRFEPYCRQTGPFENGFGFLVSSEGIIAGHPEKGFVGRDIKDWVSQEERIPLGTALRSGHLHVLFDQSLFGRMPFAYVVFIPFRPLPHLSPWSFAAAVPEGAVMTNTRLIGYRAAAIGSISILSLILLIFSLSRHIVKPLYMLVDVSKSLAEGDFNRRAHIDSSDEFGMAGQYIDKAFDIVIDKMFWYEGMMDAIPFPISVTDTDLRWTFINRAMEEVIGAGRSSVAGKHCREYAANICSRDHCSIDLLKQGKSMSTFTIPSTDRHFQIDAAWLHNARGDRVGHIEVIQDITESTRLKKKADDRNWQRTGEVGLNNVMRGDMSIEELGKNILSFICPLLESQAGVFYVMDDAQNRLLLTASYGYKKRKELSHVFEPGDGVAGQSAVEKQVILVRNVPEEYLTIRSGLGSASPASLAAVPLMFEDQVKGVMELAAFHDFSDLHMKFLEDTAVQIGVVIHTVHSRHQLKQLLEHTQLQAEKLREQQEALQRTNLELESQTRALKASEADLQAQQEELRVTNEELEERTKALEIQRDEVRQKNQALRKAQKEIEQKAKDLEIAGRYKNQFLANMSHELRTPLNSILILSQLLVQNKEGNLTGKQMEFAQTIHSSGADLLSLINEILDLSKVEAGKPDIVLEEMSMSELIDTVRRTFDPVAAQKNLRFDTEIRQGAPEYIFTDRKRIWQILKNLLSNAFKFTEQGRVSLTLHRSEPHTVFTAPGLSAGAAVAFSVTDTGIGIPKDKEEIIFNAFQQADGTTSRRFGGTGLGLSISREFTKFLGGEIQLKSEPGKGSVFTLYLPEHTGSPEAATPSATHPSGPSAENTISPPLSPMIRDDRRNLKDDDKVLLIIEDDPYLAKTLLEKARQRGFKGLIAEDGETGLHFADFYRPTAILLDADLMGTDGGKTTDRLKENPDTSHIPVHVISAGDLPPSEKWLNETFRSLRTVPPSGDGLSSTARIPDKDASLKNKTIMIVDDDMRNVFALASVLEEKGAHVIEAKNGLESIDKLNGRPDMDLVIMDIMMPAMDGYEAIRRIRTDQRFKTLPIIALTAKAMKGDKQKCIDAGASDYIAKPVDMGKLLSLLRVWLYA